MRWLSGLVCVLLFVPGVADAQRAAPTPVIVESDTLDRVLQDFLDPCRAVQSYVRELGYNPTSTSLGMRNILGRSWDIVALGLAYVAVHPEVAQAPVGLRAEIRNIVARGATGERVFPGGNDARTLADALDAAVARWESGSYSADEAPGLALVAFIMSDPGRAALYRASVEYAAIGQPSLPTRRAVAPVLPPACS